MKLGTNPNKGMIAKTLVLACTVGYAGPGLAQELDFRMDATLSCLSGAEDVGAKRACIGASANLCMERTPGGYSTVGMNGCLDRELSYWDGRLNDSYGGLRAREQAQDRDYGGGPGYLKRADALRDMQRAWIPYRDATCAYERAQWGGGTGGGPATLSCLMYLTAEQALYLESAAADF